MRIPMREPLESAASAATSAARSWWTGTKPDPDDTDTDTDSDSDEDTTFNTSEHLSITPDPAVDTSAPTTTSPSHSTSSHARTTATSSHTSDDRDVPVRQIIIPSGKTGGEDYIMDISNRSELGTPVSQHEQSWYSRGLSDIGGWYDEGTKDVRVPTTDKQSTAKLSTSKPEASWYSGMLSGAKRLRDTATEKAETRYRRLHTQGILGGIAAAQSLITRYNKFNHAASCRTAQPSTGHWCTRPFTAVGRGASRVMTGTRVRAETGIANTAYYTLEGVKWRIKRAALKSEKALQESMTPPSEGSEPTQTWLEYARDTAKSWYNTATTAATNRFSEARKWVDSNIGPVVDTAYVNWGGAHRNMAERACWCDTGRNEGYCIHGVKDYAEFSRAWESVNEANADKMETKEGKE